MPLVRFIGVWQPCTKVPEKSRRLKPFLIRLSVQKRVHKAVLDKNGQWYMLKDIWSDGVRAVEVLKITSGFEWYDNQVVLNKQDIGVYLDEGPSNTKES